MARILMCLILVACTCVSAEAQDVDSLITSVLRYGQSQAEADGQLPPGPIFLDTAQIGAVHRALGKSPPTDWSQIRMTYGTRALHPVASYDEILEVGKASDPRLLELIAAAETRDGIRYRRPAGRLSDATVVWVRDFGTYASIRLTEVLDPITVRIEVVHKRSGGFSMPFGVTPIMEATWLGNHWRLKEVARKT